MTKEKLILVGGGGHCKSCIDVIEAENKLEIAGIIDVEEKIGQEVLGYKIIAGDNDLPQIITSYKYFFITLGQINTANRRIELFHFLKNKLALLPIIISPYAIVSKYASIDEGTIVMHNVLINASAKIGKNCIINSKALVEHDAEIGDHCHIATGAIVNGGVKIGDETFYGSGAVSKQYIIIPKKSFIKANSTVK